MNVDGDEMVDDWIVEMWRCTALSAEATYGHVESVPGHTPHVSPVQRPPSRFRTDNDHGQLAWRRECRTPLLAPPALRRYEEG